jgi:hypothetical protein
MPVLMMPPVRECLDAIDLAWAKLPPKPNPGITPR